MGEFDSKSTRYVYTTVILSGTVIGLFALALGLVFFDLLVAAGIAIGAAVLVILLASERSVTQWREIETAFYVTALLSAIFSVVARFQLSQESVLGTVLDTRTIGVGVLLFVSLTSLIGGRLSRNMT